MFGKNLKKIRSVHGMSQQEFAELFDLKRATLGAYEEDRSNPKLETIIKIANHFSISIEDLLTKELTVNRLLKFNEAITLVPESNENNLAQGVICITTAIKQKFIELYKADANNTEGIPRIYLPNVSGSDMLAMVVDDLSMSGGVNGFLPKDIVIGKKVVIKHTIPGNGDLGIVLTKSALYFREINTSERNLLLTANHPGVAPVTLPIKEVRAIWQVVHIFRYTLPATSNEMEQRLAKLENSIASLRKKPE